MSSLSELYSIILFNSLLFHLLWFIVPFIIDRKKIRNMVLLIYIEDFLNLEVSVVVVVVSNDDLIPSCCLILIDDSVSQCLVCLSSIILVRIDFL